MTQVRNRFNQIFFLILLTGLAVRIFVVFFTDLRWVSDDSETYLFMADSILAGKPASYFPNGFPLFISLFKLILPASFVNPAIIICNILFSTATVAVGILLVKRIFNCPFLALIVGFLIAFYPNQINYTRHIMTEAPTTFFLISSVYLLLRKNYTSSAILIFLVTIFRTSFLPLIPIFLIATYFQNRESKYYNGVFSFGFSMALCMLLYSILIIYDIIKPSSNLDGNLLISIQSYSHNINFRLEGFSEFEKLHPFQTYFQFAMENPGVFLKQRISSLQELWGWPSTGMPPNQRGFLAQLLISIRLPLILFTVYEMIKRYKDLNHWILFSPILVLTLVHVPLFSMPRFNVVVEPFLIILAILALNDILSNVTIYNSVKTNIENALK